MPIHIYRNAEFGTFAIKEKNGDQPAKKRLKDRKGRTSNVEDTRHYQRIISVLKEMDENIKYH